jgi:hypothetical protein
MVAALWVSGGVLFVLSEWFVYENDRFPRALFAHGNATWSSRTRSSGGSRTLVVNQSMPSCSKTRRRIGRGA